MDDVRGTKCERDKQQKPWRKVTLEQATSSSISSINEFLGRGEDPLMDEILDAGIDWIPRDILSSTVNKAISLTAKPGGVTLQSKDTVIVASSSKPRKPHIVNIFPNGSKKVPNDLVIVSKMLREWSYQGTAQSKMANVYFHCKSSCVVKKQADFDGRLCSIPPQIEAHLVELHRAYLRRNFGI